VQWKSTQQLKTELTKNWSTHEWLHFLRNLPHPLTIAQLENLDQAGHFTKSGNAEITTAWLTLAIQFNYEKAYPKLEDFLIHTGRRKFLSPLYSEMIKTEAGKKRAQEIYTKARPNYHFVATNTFDKMLL
jgi:leukotriene-A4 hydrolase